MPGVRIPLLGPCRRGLCIVRDDFIILITKKSAFLLTQHIKYSIYCVWRQYEMYSTETNLCFAQKHMYLFVEDSDLKEPVTDAIL